MKTRNEKMKLGALAFAVQGALLAMCAMPAHAAEDDAAVDLKTPTNYVEIGAENVSNTSPKFGEYNGLDKKGGYVIGNFGVRGGDAYGSTTGTRLWEVSGKDLGLTSRSLNATMSDQGKWQIGIGYDQLQHNTATGYQTPYVGSMGGNSFMLPAGFGGVRQYVTGATNDGGTSVATATRNLVNGALPSNLAQGTLGLTAAQKAAFHDMDINNTRKNSSFNAKVFLNPELKVTFDYNRLKQDGAKLMGMGADGSLDNAVGVAITAAVATNGNEKASILPMPYDFTTDTFNLGLHWAGENANLSASYNGSYFKDTYQSVSFQSFWLPTPASYTATAATPWLGAVGTVAAIGQPIDAITTPPDNQLHQLNLIGGYAFSKETKLAGGLSYGRNTQSQAFVDSELTYRGRPTQVLDPITQIGSANALVVTTHADLKLTNQTTKDLKLSAGVKYDQHNNRTASNIYDFSSIGYGGAATQHETLYPNNPLSNKKTQLELAGDYRVNAAQNVRLAYNREDVKRWCDNYAVSAASYATVAATATTPLSTIAATLVQPKYPAGTNCVVATAQKDDKLSADYRNQLNEDVFMRAGYAYSDRKTTSDPLARTAFMTGNILSGNANILGLNAGDPRGFYPIFDASRTQHLIKASMNWQANDQLSVDLGGRYAKDKYGDSTYGAQKGDQWSLNLDATYAYSDSGSITPYITQQRRTRDMTNAGGNIAAVVVAALPTATTNAVIGQPALGPWAWTNNLTDEDFTLGIGVKQGDLLGGKLELKGDLTYSHGKVSQTTAFVAPAGQNCNSPTLMSCGALPDITNKMTRLKLAGDYKLDKQSKVALGYTFQKLESNDFWWNGQQTGYTPNSVLPTNQQSGSYHVNVVTAAYVYSFK